MMFGSTFQTGVGYKISVFSFYRVDNGNGGYGVRGSKIYNETNYSKTYYSGVYER